MVFIAPLIFARSLTLLGLSVFVFFSLSKENLCKLGNFFLPLGVCLCVDKVVSWLQKMGFFFSSLNLAYISLFLSMSCGIRPVCGWRVANRNTRPSRPSAPPHNTPDWVTLWTTEDAPYCTVVAQPPCQGSGKIRGVLQKTTRENVLWRCKNRFSSVCVCVCVERTHLRFGTRWNFSFLHFFLFWKEKFAVWLWKLWFETVCFESGDLN